MKRAGVGPLTIGQETQLPHAGPCKGTWGKMNALTLLFSLPLAFCWSSHGQYTKEGAVGTSVQARLPVTEQEQEEGWRGDLKIKLKVFTT